jgi:hypothetical protein
MRYARGYANSLPRVSGFEQAPTKNGQDRPRVLPVPTPYLSLLP